MLAFKQQRSLGAFSRQKLGPAHHPLSCSHTATCLPPSGVDGVLLQPGPHRAPQGPTAPGGVWREGWLALGRLTPGLNHRTQPRCVQLPEIVTLCLGALWLSQQILPPGRLQQRQLYLLTVWRPEIKTEA